ncbi:Auxin Efflux Carrier [Dethiosulfovibrio peptidovorans DSM 11002]|uniref:Auxin Efflux Carrier n=1 Tax=Dethiosulfovibrio peptidovorans DSM 11002 TaxID=469381 RepID=D2Z6R1_9BACT|nr:AEC family transporter [Dethiosulfovibrio peptidovorans]EFC91158.1 Auxin Efflux Carrier [Dethiosulfovibrio peptidovorans DSM 11002]
MRGFLTILPVVLVMAAGWGLKRLDRMDQRGADQINSVLFWLIMPAILLEAGMDIDVSVFSDWGYISVLYGAFAVVVLSVFAVVSRLGLPKERAAVSVLGAVRSNVVFVGLPLVSTLMGDVGVSALTIYLSIGMIFYNTFPIACAQMAMEGRFSPASVNQALVKALRTPLILAGFTGIMLSVTGIKDTFPQWFFEGLELLTDCGSGMALLVIGASLRLEKLAAGLARSWGDLLVKLVLFPAAMYVGFHLLPPRDPLLARTTVLIASLSPAFNTYILANGMGLDSDYAAEYVATATVVGIVTTAVWIEILF